MRPRGASTTDAGRAVHNVETGSAVTRGSRVRDPEDCGADCRWHFCRIGGFEEDTSGVPVRVVL